MSFFYIPDFK